VCRQAAPRARGGKEAKRVNFFPRFSARREKTSCLSRWLAIRGPNSVTLRFSSADQFFCNWGAW
jgi:hypothetical protein